MRYDVSLLSDQDLHFFNEGTHCRLYERLGARQITVDGQEGTCFAVWAPNAQNVFLTGDFNEWNRTSHPLRPKGDSGIWEGFIAGVCGGSVYKYHIVSRHGGLRFDKADPFSSYNEVPPDTGSIVWDPYFDLGLG
jgi:1,4-alpha-glucan branching enzyme